MQADEAGFGSRFSFSVYRWRVARFVDRWFWGRGGGLRLKTRFRVSTLRFFGVGIRDILCFIIAATVSRLQTQSSELPFLVCSSRLVSCNDHNSNKSNNRNKIVIAITIT